MVQYIRVYTMHIMAKAFSVMWGPCRDRGGESGKNVHRKELHTSSAKH